MDVSRDRLYFADVSNQRVRAVDLVSGVITTVAGGGSADIGDGGPATAATFSTHPMRVMVNGDDLYITDAHQNKVRRVDATGTITTYAGNGTESFSGDGGAATAAGLSVPHGARFDGDGNLFIADTHNQRIRRVDGRTGLITTVAGSGRTGFSGDDGPAVDADLASPLAVDLDGDGNLYIADTNNDRIRRVDAATGTITTVAGVGEIGPLVDGVAAREARFGRLRDVVVAANGNLVVADGNNSVICRIDLSEGVIRLVAGTGTDGFSGDGGAATAAQLQLPYSIALDEDQNLFIKDSCNCRIRRVDAVSGTIATIAGSGDYGFSGDGGPALEARLATGK
jgi:sugar lactone lactonase YvrE